MVLGEKLPGRAALNRLHDSFVFICSGCQSCPCPALPNFSPIPKKYFFPALRHPSHVIYVVQFPYPRLSLKTCEHLSTRWDFAEPNSGKPLMNCYFNTILFQQHIWQPILQSRYTNRTACPLSFYFIRPLSMHVYKHRCQLAVSNFVSEQFIDRYSIVGSH